MTPLEFKNAREGLGYTQTEIAAIWGMGANGDRTIRRWESGAVPVNPVAAFCIRLMLESVARESEKDLDNAV